VFHGPTLAFKDVALQLVGRLFDHELRARGERVTIVGATSGDTGSAAIEACRDRDAIDIVVLHPAGRVLRGAAAADDHRACRPTSTTWPSRARSTIARTW
jgi:threonine synthase